MDVVRNIREVIRDLRESEDSRDQNTQYLNCKGHTSLVISLCVFADGRLASGSSEKTIRIWNMRGGEWIQESVLKGHTSENMSMDEFRKSVEIIIDKVDCGSIYSGCTINTIAIIDDVKEPPYITYETTDTEGIRLLLCDKIL